MKKKILWIRAVGTSALDMTFQRFLDEAKEPDTEIRSVSLKRGPLHLAYRYYGALVLPDILYNIKRAEEAGYDAVVVACFLDIGLPESREITRNLVLTGPGEASLHIGATLGCSQSIIVGQRHWIPKLKEVITRIGLNHTVASIRHVGIEVPDLRRDQAKTEQALAEAARQAVEQDGAEVILLGCTMNYGFYEKLQTELGIPVIDPMLAALKYAEFLVGIKHRFNWGHSKRYGYTAPPPEELAAFDLENHYHFSGVSR